MMYYTIDAHVQGKERGGGAMEIHISRNKKSITLSKYDCHEKNMNPRYINNLGVYVLDLPCNGRTDACKTT